MPFITELAKFKNNIFIETGTYQGDTSQLVFDLGFPKVITMELSVVFYKRCISRFENNPNIKVIFGNSKYDLTNVIQNIDSPITFWLDSHWSGVIDIGYDPDTICPVLEELEQIKSHYIKNHTIMVDDIRLMDGKHFPVLRSEIEAKIMSINSNYTIEYFDDFTSSEDILVAYIKS